ncbi:MAG: hypothetical protein KGL44_03035 [Sphingomonadales bacterium]|nr:hypothetical protein [Sphingomonadales bacterium]
MDMRGTVLVVDDNALVGYGTAQMLADAGFARVHVVATIEQAREWIDGGSLVAAVLETWASGVSTQALAIRLRQCGVPFIFVTASDDMRDIAAECFTVPCLAKPVAPNFLLGALGIAQGGLADDNA